MLQTGFFVGLVLSCAALGLVALGASVYVIASGKDGHFIAHDCALYDTRADKCVKWLGDAAAL